MLELSKTFIRVKFASLLIGDVFYIVPKNTDTAFVKIGDPDFNAMIQKDANFFRYKISEHDFVYIIKDVGLITL